MEFQSILPEMSEQPKRKLFNRNFRRRYRSIFKRDPLAANIFLLLTEMAGWDGKVVLPADLTEVERELRTLISVRFEDPRGWQL